MLIQRIEDRPWLTSLCSLSLYVVVPWYGCDQQHPQQQEEIYDPVADPVDSGDTVALKEEPRADAPPDSTHFNE